MGCQKVEMEKDMMIMVILYLHVLKHTNRGDSKHGERPGLHRGRRNRGDEIQRRPGGRNRRFGDYNQRSSTGIWGKGN